MRSNFVKYFALVLIFLTSPAIAYDATYNFDDFLDERQTKILLEIEGRLHAQYEGKIPQGALQSSGLEILQTMTIFQRIQALKIAAACNNDVYSYCRSVPQTSAYVKECVQTRKALLSRSCDTTLKTTLGETLKRNAIIQRVSLPPHTKLSHQLRSDGKTSVASVTTKQTISDHGATFAPGLVELGKVGVVSGVLHRDAIVQGLPFKASNKPLTFHDNGTVESGILSRDATYQGMTFKTGTSIILHNNRSVRSGTLAKDTRINDIDMPAGKRLYFTADGKLSSS